MKTIAKKAAVYARYSTDMQDARSIEDQMRRCQVFAARQNMDVVATYSDSAVSGAHTHRADLQRMFLGAKNGEFNNVIVDDLSRLSRDLGNTWDIVFGKLASNGVAVVDATTGMASNQAGARLTFGAVALVNDAFLEMVKAETHRGLEGRALKGFWTGGRVYGYVTVVENNPPDPEHPRKILVKHADEAKIVVRIFSLFADGCSLKAIADRLNTEQIPAPHDGGKGNKIGRGWQHTSIRALLLNQRYVGKTTWNTSQWMRVPGKKGRRRIARDPSEWITREIPELRIVDDDLWNSVQQRFQATRKGRGNKHGVGAKQGVLFSGMMKCGVCGGSFNIVSRREKNGVSYVGLGCSASRSRGIAICSNRRNISNSKLIQLVTDELQKLVQTPRLLEVFVEEFTREVTKTQRTENTRDIERQIREAERRVTNITEALAMMGFSDAVRAKAAEEERRLTSLRSQLAVTKTQIVIPHPKTIEGYLNDVLGMLQKDVPQGRALLQKVMQPLVLTPEADGYRITGGFNLNIKTATLEDQSRVRLGSGGKI